MIMDKERFETLRDLEVKVSYLRLRFCLSERPKQLFVWIQISNAV